MLEREKGENIQLVFTITNEYIQKGMGVISTPEVSLSYSQHRGTLYMCDVIHHTSNKFNP